LESIRSNSNPIVLSCVQNTAGPAICRLRFIAAVILARCLPIGAESRTFPARYPSARSTLDCTSASHPSATPTQPQPARSSPGRCIPQGCDEAIVADAAGAESERLERVAPSFHPIRDRVAPRRLHAAFAQAFPGSLFALTASFRAVEYGLGNTTLRRRRSPPSLTTHIYTDGYGGKRILVIRPPAAETERLIPLSGSNGDLL